MCVFLSVCGSKSALSCRIMNNALSACPSAEQSGALNRVVFFVRNGELNSKVIYVPCV